MKTAYSVLLSSKNFLLDFTSEKKEGVSVFIVYSGMGTIGR